jgi:hypothetical protein
MPNTTQKELIEFIQRLEWKADDIRAQLEDIDPFEDIEFTDPDGDADLIMREELIDLAEIAGQLSDRLAALKVTAEEVTK